MVVGVVLPNIPVAAAPDHSACTIAIVTFALPGRAQLSGMANENVTCGIGGGGGAAAFWGAHDTDHATAAQMANRAVVWFRRY